jgi:hypothetical protein
VFTRVRPLLGSETIGNSGEIPHIHFPDSDHCTLEIEKLSDANPNEVCKYPGVVTIGCLLYHQTSASSLSTLPQ